MKLNPAERLMVNNPVRAFIQLQIIRWMAKHGRLTPGSRVLEIGCGRGAGAVMVQREFQTGAITAVDMDPRMIRTACKRLSRQSGGIDFCVAEASQLPFEDESFDAVFAFGMLHHVPDWRAALRQIARVLNRGGTYYIEEYYPASYQNAITKHILKHPEEDRFVGPDLFEAVRQSGLTLLHHKEIRGLGVLGVSLKD